MSILHRDTHRTPAAAPADDLIPFSTIACGLLLVLLVVITLVTTAAAAGAGGAYAGDYRCCCCCRLPDQPSNITDIQEGGYLA